MSERLFIKLVKKHGFTDLDKNITSDFKVLRKAYESEKLKQLDGKEASRDVISLYEEILMFLLQKEHLVEAN